VQGSEERGEVGFSISLLDYTKKLERWQRSQQYRASGTVSSHTAAAAAAAVQSFGGKEADIYTHRY
jgi:hypothetical protein